MEKQHQCLVFALWKHSLGSLNCLEFQPGVKWLKRVEARRRWTIELCQSRDTSGHDSPIADPCLSRCWAGDRATLQLNIAAFTSDVPPQIGDCCCCRTDILEALVPPGELHIHLPLAALVPCYASAVGKLQLIQTKPWQACCLSQPPHHGLFPCTDSHRIWTSRPLFPFPSTK